ncbi:hypothetical protein [Streptosporangium longisporum]|uniref:VMAP-C domain-containing protein n=1 Tax=Streptosporangium longisporum TaxID=46187 RepID=UPI0031E7207B
MPNAPTPAGHMLRVVERTLAAEGGAYALQTSVRYLLGASTPVIERLRKLLGSADPVMEPDAEETIVRLLRACQLTGLRHLYYEVTDSGGRYLPPHLTTALQIYDFLRDSNARPGALPPVLLFVVELYLRLVHQEPGQDPQLSFDLHRWIDAQGARFHRNGDEEAARRLEQLMKSSPSFQTRTDFPVYLVIEISPLPVSDDGRDLHRIVHWSQADQPGWNPVRGPEVELPLEEIPPYVEELVERTEETRSNTRGGPLLLEFLLSEELLDLAVERWPRRTGGLLPPRPLGADYEVVLRSDEHLRPRSRHRHWHQRWDQVVREEGTVYFVPVEAVAPGMMHAELLRGERLVACVLSIPPRDSRGRVQLAAAIDAGLPIVLWCRDIRMNADFRRMAADFLHPRGLRQLPTGMHALRSAEPGYDVALLWDDPTRPMPRAPRLRSPA